MSKTTYYIQFKSLSNPATEALVHESASPMLIDGIKDFALNAAKRWGESNGSDAVDYTVENYVGNVIVRNWVCCERPVSLTVTREQARIVLSALNRRFEELDSLGGPEAETARDAARATYQSIDKQVYGE